MKISPQAGGALYEQVKSAIRQCVQRGHWPVGHRLPTLKQLSSDLNIAYATVERGVRELVEEGLLQGRKRGGTVVAQPRRAKLQTIGILGSMTFKRMMENSRYGFALLNLLQERIIEARRTVVYNHWESDQPLTEVFNRLSLVDGLLIFGPHHRSLSEVDSLRNLGVPAVYLGISTSDDIATVDSANTDDTRKAVQLLLARGHQRIAYACHSFSARTLPNLQRLDGYRQAMAQTPLGIDPRCIITGTVPEQAQALLKLSPAPTAMFYPSAREFPQLHEQLKGTPLEPGRSLAVCVYDDNLWNTVTPLGIEFMDIEQPLRQIANSAVENLLRMLDDSRFHPGRVEFPSAVVAVSREGMRSRIDL